MFYNFIVVFYRSLLFYFLASLMAFLGPQKSKFAGIQSVYICIVDTFPNRAGIETWMQSWRFMLHMVNHLFFTSQQQHPCPLCWLALSLTNQWLPNYDTNMTSSNILSLGSSFSQHRPLEKL